MVIRFGWQLRARKTASDDGGVLQRWLLQAHAPARSEVIRKCSSQALRDAAPKHTASNTDAFVSLRARRLWVPQTVAAKLCPETRPQLWPLRTHLGLLWHRPHALVIYTCPLFLSPPFGGPFCLLSLCIPSVVISGEACAQAFRCFEHGQQAAAISCD